MDDTDRRLLDRIQADVPLVPRPFEALGRDLGIGEQEVIARLSALKAQRVLRQIGPIFDTARLGYRSCLVAARVPVERVDQAAAAVGQHPGVSHCYLREHGWNLWFTLAVPPTSALGLEGTAARLQAAAGAESLRLLPALRVFKIGVRLAMIDEGSALPQGGPCRDARAEPGGARFEGPGHDTAAAPSAEERAVIVALQDPLPLVPEPFAAAAAAVGASVEQLLDMARGLRARGLMRRFAGVLHHRSAGYAANAMGVWGVPPERIEEVGCRMASFPAVSHCYQRPTYPDWPYSVFTMVHGKSRQECLATLEAMAMATGVAEHAALWSVKEFKKVRLRYFTPDYAEWESRALTATGGGESRPAAPGHAVILRLAGRRVVVIGGGEVAERKVASLLEAQARVTVVSPEATEQIEGWARAGLVELERRAYRPGDLAGCMLAYAATDDPATNRAAWEEAERRGVWLNVADRPELCHFFAPAVVRRGDLTIAISTNGASPALARRIREDLERRLGEEHAEALRGLRADRERLLREEPDPARRRELLEARAAEVGLP